MSGTKIDGTYGMSYERDELADIIERETGRFSLAQDVRHGRCLTNYDLHSVESALDRAGKSKHFDYREHRCFCGDEEGEDGR